jgi:hypothetical protein
MTGEEPETSHSRRPFDEWKKRDPFFRLHRHLRDRRERILISKGHLQPKTAQEDIDIDRETSCRVVDRKEDTQVRLANQIALLAGIFITLSPSIFLVQAEGTSATSWKVLMVVLFGVGWLFAIASMHFGVACHTNYDKALSNNPNYHYSAIEWKSDKHKWGPEDPFYLSQRRFLFKMQVSLIRSKWCLGVAAVLITSAILLTTIVVLFKVK